MKDKIIIHLSDLHVSKHLDKNGDPLNRISSYITTKPDRSDNESFIDHLCEFLEYKFSETDRILFISGDITDQGYEEEFTVAKEVLEKICTKLTISKSKVLIVPGDHDINRLTLESAFRASDGSKKPYLMNDVKFKDFSSFYNSLIGEIFEFDKCICKFLVLDDEKLLIVGLNSNGRIGAESGNGYIDKVMLKNELKEICSKYSDYSRISVFHHNLEGQFEDKQSGQWDPDNKVDIIQLFEEYKFNAVFYGNEHTPASNTRNQLMYISAASLGKKNVNPGFRVYKVNSEDGELSLKNYRFNLINDGAKTSKSFGNWSEVDFNGANENLPNIVLRKPLYPKIIEPSVDFFGNKDGLNLSSSNIIEHITNGSERELEVLEKNIRVPLQPEIDFSPNIYHEKIFKIIKEKKYFVSGHFHWSDSSKAHNWINVPLFLADREHLILAQKAIFDVIVKNDLNFDFILGLGIEGNILATYVAAKTGIRYSYLPYSYRYQDHALYEKNLHITNNDDFHHILVITDVINNGKTVERLIKAETNFFKTELIKSINVVSLFYTGDPSETPLNKVIDNRVRNYFVSHMKVEKCPYGNDFRESCMIYREKLDCVHEFYDANKVI